MKSHKFGYSNDILNRHFYAKEGLKLNPKAQLLKRLQNEFKKMEEELPCEIDNSIFVMVQESNPQLIKALIMGSRGTPYEHGLFEYDIFVPDDYPLSSPKCNLITTGNGLIRFNPNLYNSGYVCLSLLGNQDFI